MSKLFPLSIKRVVVLSLAFLFGTSAAYAASPKNPMPPRTIAKFVRLKTIDAQKFFGNDETSRASLYEARLEIIKPDDPQLKNMTDFLVAGDPAHLATDGSWRPLMGFSGQVRLQYERMAQAYLLAHDTKGAPSSSEQLEQFLPTDIRTILERQFPIGGAAPPNATFVEWRFGAFGCIEEPSYQPMVGMLAFYEGDEKGGQLFWRGRELCRGDGYPVPKSALIASVQTFTESKGTLLLIAIGIGLLATLALGVLMGLAPILIAKRRGHPNLMPIAITTILLGWTFIGWAVCLAWSFSSTNRSQQRVVR